MPGPSIFTSVINSYLPEPHASLLNGILFGINLKTSKEFYQALKTVGLLHIVVLSGMNITILASIIMVLSKNFSRQIACLLTVLSIILFTFFVGFQAPIVRASFMGILTFVAIIYGRKNYVFYSLFLSGLFIFLIWPEWLKTVSFQLSYGATLGIILFGQTRQVNPNNLFGRLLGGLKKELRLTLSAQIFTVPLIFIYFKQFSLIAPLSNILVAPIIPPLMIFGFMTAILGKISFILGLIPAYVCFGILSYMVFVIEMLSKLPFVFFTF